MPTDPALPAVTTPVAVTDAMVVDALLQLPPVVASTKVVVPAGHIDMLPVIGAGNGYTTTNLVVIQLAGVVYVIVAVPPAVPTPSTTPVAGSTLAIVLSLLLHVPPGVISLNVVVDPTHTPVVPVIGDNGFTVTCWVT
jgi:hypothetical protein